MIDIVDLSIQYNGKFLFENVNLKINKGDRIALVGANGTGKSTLLKLICGLEESESGKILSQKGIKIGYLSQEFTELKGKTLFEEVKLSLSEIILIEKEEENITELLSNKNLSEAEHLELAKKLGEINHKKDDIGFYSIDSEIKKVLEGLGFTERDFERLTDEFSGGWQMRIELAKILINSNDIILLDEPTNHLDIETLRWLIAFLKNYKGAILLVSHDKFFVNSITSKTLEIFNRELSFFKGNLDAYQKFKEERDELLENQFEQQQKKIKETEKFIERFRYKATKAKQVQSRIKQLEKIDKIELTSSQKSINISFPEPPRGGAVPIELIFIDKAYEDNIVFKKNNLKIERGEKIAFVGPNGAGKTTLAKIIAKKTSIDAGKVAVGYNTIISYYAQEVAENLNPDLDILESVAEIGSEQAPGKLRSLLGSFLFSDDDVFKKVKVLSGGEKSRVALCKILLTQSNLIILDEPTNHLDFESKAILQKALIEFKGTLIIVSHDVEFLKPIVNKVIEIKEKNIKPYYGGIEYYLFKKDEEVNTKEKVEPTEEKTIASKKEQKRFEAEQRQKRFTATKDILDDIKNLEIEIENLEREKIKLESELANPEIFSNPNLSKEKNATYLQIKENLEKLFLSWSELTEKLEEIEKQFN